MTVVIVKACIVPESLTSTVFAEVIPVIVCIVCNPLESISLKAVSLLGEYVILTVNSYSLVTVFVTCIIFRSVIIS